MQVQLRYCTENFTTNFFAAASLETGGPRVISADTEETVVAADTAEAGKVSERILLASNELILCLFNNWGFCDGLTFVVDI